MATYSANLPANLRSTDAAAPDARRLCHEGYAHLEPGRLAEARALLARACELAPDYPLAHFRLALCHSDAGRYAEALAELDRTVALEPDNGRAHNNRGTAPQMLGRTQYTRQAFRRARGLYDELHEAEIGAWLRDCADASFDLVVAADLFIYVGTLDAIFAEAARALRSGGRFALSIENCDDADYRLRPTGRYAQDPRYIARIAAPRFATDVAQPATICSESGVDIAGHLFVLRRAQDASEAEA